ncbi:MULTISPECIES: hypothetical protein [Sphingobacterium]|uniref:hypothetical protein n=1 Tax=Sphingobacterium TaxID=28453 RepID=UPI00257F0805|nr:MULTISPECIES: hypothetical protein [Sphingobacterium]
MRTKSLYIFLVTLCLLDLCYGQDAIKPRRHIVANNNIYLIYNDRDNSLEYFDFAKDKRSSQDVIDNDQFEVKGNTSCNVYVSWLNPLKYRISFKDSVYEDPDIKVLSDFLKLAYGSLNTSAASGSKSVDKAPEASNNIVGNKLKLYGQDSILFNDRDLRRLQLNILMASYTDAEQSIMKGLYQELRYLDTAQRDNLSKMKEGVAQLATIKDALLVDGTVQEVGKSIKKMENNLTEITKILNKLKPLRLVLEDKLIQEQIILSVEDYIEKVEGKNKIDYQGIEKVKLILQLFEDSIIEPDSKGSVYFRAKKLNFNEDKYFKTVLSVTKYDIDATNFEIKKGNDVTKKSMIFKKFDPVKISVSTGIFFASFTLKGFGVAQGTTDLTVTEDDIKSNTAIPATFLNFNFDFGSRTLLPILQIGADPTKKRPFVMIGGGFAIPKSKFAITGGPIWTWEQKLDKLKVDGPVASTTELENDIKYSFNMSPKGWYLGLQFEF